MKPRDQQILRIAMPAIASNITVPLLGLVDVSVVGHLGAASYIGAIAVGGMLFNVICWVFAFLRMGTSGLTSQAFGRRDLMEVVRLLVRSVGVGLAVGLCFCMLQSPVRRVAFSLLKASDDVLALTSIYFNICIWGVPAMLGLYGLSGWYIGMQNSRIPMWMAIVQNITNIVATLFLVFVCGWKVEGVATGTVIAQYTGLILALCLWRKHYGRLWRYLWTGGGWRAVWSHGALLRFFRVNRDIFLRTLCLVAVTMFFTSAGAAQGEVILAVNTLLMQFFMLYSFVMDGFAYAGEALSGRFVGANHRAAYIDTVRRLFVWGGLTMTVFTLAYGFFGDSILGLLTDDASVVQASASFSGWAVAIPVVGMAAFVWDGVFVGSTATREMLLSMAIAAGSFFVLQHALRPSLGNHGLWIAFLTYLLMRGVVQTWLARGVIRRAFPTICGHKMRPDA